MNLIAALSLNQCIGNKGKVPFKIKEDLKRFKQLTTENIVIMGSRTFFDDLESKPLDDRVNIVVSSKAKMLTYKYPFSSNSKLYIVDSPVEAVELAKDLTEFDTRSTWVMGGASLYSYYLEKDLVTSMYLTHNHSAVDGDTYFKVNWAGWQVDEEEHHQGYSYVKYTRIPT